MLRVILTRHGHSTRQNLLASFATDSSFDVKAKMMDLAVIKAKNSLLRTDGKRAHKKALKWKDNAHEMWEFFSEYYGDRWESTLCQALLKPPKMTALMNPSIVTDTQNLEPLSWAPPILQAFCSKGQDRLPTPTRDADLGISNYYCMDPSSLLPPLALNLHNSTFPSPPLVLDMCAAPGGKALAIMKILSQVGGILVANEPSKERRERLERVMDEHIMDTSNFYMTSLDGVAYGKPDQDFSDLEGPIMGGKSKLSFSHILCDAPCTAERHVLHRTGGGEWKRKSTKNKGRQKALLKAAWAACRVGGTIVFSTCSLSYGETDEIIKKVMAEKPFELIPPDLPIGEATECGWMVLPDHPSSIGMGPMYIAVLRKLDEYTIHN